MAIEVRSAGVVRRKLFIAERGDLESSGPTKSEAKANLERKIDFALTGSYRPVLVKCGPYSVLVWREPSGFSYSILRDTETDGIHEPSSCAVGFESRDEAINAACAHAFQIGADITAIRTDSQIPDWVRLPRDRDNILCLGRFQRAYRWAKENQPEGISPDDGNALHRWACDHDREFA